MGNYVKSHSSPTSDC